MRELYIPDDVDNLTPSTMIDELETLAVKNDTDGLTEAERKYQDKLREMLTDAFGQ